MSSTIEAPGAADAPHDERDVIVTTTRLTKRFNRNGENFAAVDNVSLDVRQGEFVVLLGPSGCGKTTLLRQIAGLEKPTEGEIVVNGRKVFSSAENTNLPPERRRLSMVFQSYALWPHMKVAENVAYPLHSRRSEKGNKAEFAERVRKVLDMVGIPDLHTQYPTELSGGQQQRVALARALVAGDRLVLFDEPLSNVDAKVRAQLRTELVSMQRELGFAAVYVTHDQAEAMEMADRIAVMEKGKLVQLGTPADVYNDPASRYVANFIGTTNEFLGRVSRGTSADATVRVTTSFGEVTATPGRNTSDLTNDVVIASRPEACRLSQDLAPGENTWRGVVRHGHYLGTHTQYVVDLAGTSLHVWSADRRLLDAGTEVCVSLDPQDVRVFPV